MELNPWYVSGFVDGEGSFLVSFSLRQKLRVGVEVRPSFTVSQHKRNRALLEALQRFFGCGDLRFNTHDDTWKYEVRRLDDLIQNMTPHFERYPLRTSKQKDFETLRAICVQMKSDEHRSQSGIRQIIASAYAMNNLGARRYHRDELLTVVGKMNV